MDEEEDENGKKNIVIDNGSDSCKVGFSGDEGPLSIVPSYVGYPNYNPPLLSDKNNPYLGEDAQNNLGILSLSYPINHGMVTNWDDMEKIYNYIFTNKLKLDPVEHKVIFTEPLINPKKNREKLVEIMFDTFNVPGMSLILQVLSDLYAGGKFSGFVVDSGEGLTQFAYIGDGYVLSESSMKINLSGGEATNYMFKLLQELGLNLTINEKGIAKEIKEKACYVALNFEKEMKSVEKLDYELPDGNKVVIEDQRIRCPEAFFTPSNIGIKGIGLPKICYDLIQKCNIYIKKDVYNCICLFGGNSLFKGFPERFTKEMQSLVPGPMKDKVNVIASPERKNSAWIGGSIISSVSGFESNFITKTEYEENGPSAIKKFLRQ